MSAALEAEWSRTPQPFGMDARSSSTPLPPPAVGGMKVHYADPSRFVRRRPTPATAERVAATAGKPDPVGPTSTRWAVVAGAALMLALTGVLVWWRRRAGRLLLCAEGIVPSCRVGILILAIKHLTPLLFLRFAIPPPTSTLPSHPESLPSARRRCSRATWGGLARRPCRRGWRRRRGGCRGRRVWFWRGLGYRGRSVA